MLEKSKAINSRVEPTLVIHPGIGLSDVKFGAEVRQVIARFGPPADDHLDQEGDRILTFPNLGISFFAFDCEDEFRLTSFEVNHRSDAELWGKRVFGISLGQMTELARLEKASLEKSNRDIPKDEEEFYQVRSQALDFYYQEGKLVSAAAGVLSDEQGNIRWPL